MDYFFHAFGILCIVHAAICFLARKELSPKAKRTWPVSIVASVIYVLWLFRV